MVRIGGLVSAVQQGVSKKSGKPYAMVTVEDLTGSVQLLCMNESYDKYRELFVVNTPVLVTGEVSLNEDRPKIFPVEILSLEDAPRRLTKQVHLRLETAELQRSQLEALRDLMVTHRGAIPVILRLTRPDGVSIYVEPSDYYSVTPSMALQCAVDELFGAGTYLPKADLTLPERTPRKWERKGNTGDGEE